MVVVAAVAVAVAVADAVAAVAVAIPPRARTALTWPSARVTPSLLACKWAKTSPDPFHEKTSIQQSPVESCDPNCIVVA